MPKKFAQGKAAAPRKPHPDFPLTPNGNGQWSKKVKGKVYYFGLWADPDAALQRWMDEKDSILAGRSRTRKDGTTVADLCNRFLTTKRMLLDCREITAATFTDYYQTCEKLVATFGKGLAVADLVAEDFEKLRGGLAKTLGPVALGNEINRVRMVFKYALDQTLIVAPIRYGQSFNRPNEKVLRETRNAKGPRMLEADELRKLIEAASPAVCAMILLAANCGYGNTDVSLLPVTALDLNAGWSNFPRPKTGIQRRCPLWPETVAAVKAAIVARPAPTDPANDGLVFITKYGRPWVRVRAPGDAGSTTAASNIDSVALEFGKLLRELKLSRPGLGFYAVRHTFETIGGESLDQVAVDFIMGHAPEKRDMSARYRERISDDRLRAVTDHVRAWLFPKAKANKPKAAPTKRAKAK